MQLGLIGQCILLDTGHERERRGKQVSGCGNRVDFHIQEEKERLLGKDAKVHLGYVDLKCLWDMHLEMSGRKYGL